MITLSPSWSGLARKLPYAPVGLRFTAWDFLLPLSSFNTLLTKFCSNKPLTNAHSLLRMHKLVVFWMTGTDVITRLFSWFYVRTQTECTGVSQNSGMCYRMFDQSSSTPKPICTYTHFALNPPKTVAQIEFSSKPCCNLTGNLLTEMKRGTLIVCVQAMCLLASVGVSVCVLVFVFVLPALWDCHLCFCPDVLTST